MIGKKLLAAIVAAGVLSGGAALAGATFRASLEPVWGPDEAAHLLRRAGFGGTPEQIEYLVRMGRDDAVDYLVDYEKIPIGDPPYPIGENDTRPLERRLLADLSPEERSQIQNMIRRLNDRHMESVRDWWIRRMIVTNRPLQEKMTLFWHGHFTSEYRKVRNWRQMYEQNDFLRENALGDFETLLIGISKDPAMLRYLDNARNVKTSPNENYARELMELFSLGEGEYSERDIKEAARAFTGWGVDPDGFRFYPRFHDFGTKTFFGRKGRLDGEDVVKMILRHPNASRFMARNLLEFFVYRDPEEDAVEDLARIIRDEDFVFKGVIRQLLRSDEFYSERARFSLIKSPVELAVGSVRALQIDTVNPRGLFNACREMGQVLFQPPNVKGWDSGQRWITSNTLFARYNFGRKLMGETRRRGRTLAGRMADLASPENGPATGGGMAMMDEMRMRPTLAQISGSTVATTVYDPRPVLERFELHTAEEITDHYVRRLLQRSISQERRQVLVEALSPASRPFQRNARDAAERIRALLTLIMSMPEFQLN